MSDPFRGIPLAATLTDEQLSERLGEPVRSGQDAVSTGSDRFGFAWFGGAPAWRHTSHSIGFIPARRVRGGRDPARRRGRGRSVPEGRAVAHHPGRATSG